MTDSSAEAPAALRSNLPLQLTSFVGRERERQAVQRLLSSARLVTLTGPPGCGKTRLALETGHALLDHFRDGVWLVDLTQTGDSETIYGLIVQSLRLIGIGSVDLEKWIGEYLHSRHVLIILDNCEHVVDEAARVCLSLLTACPQLHILATSQMHLGIPGEQEWLVPSLPFPEPDSPQPALETLRQYDAVQLFIERAEASQPDFHLTYENAPAITHICQRLDGIPLAIELAAARIKMLSVEEIAARLDDRLELLATPRRLVPSRHQTLQAAIDWSFQLLDPQAQLLLSRLAVFPGSFTLQAVEAVCGFDPLQSQETMKRLADLVDRSLVNVIRKDGQETRYYLLDSIRLFALARLSEEDRSHVKDRHLDYYVHLAHLFDQNQWGHSQVEWLDRLEAEWTNIRAAARLVLETQEAKRLHQGLQMTADLQWFFHLRNHISEPVHWMEQILARATANEGPEWVAARAKGHFVLGILLFTQHYGDPIVLEQFETSMRLWQKLGEHGRHGYVYPTIWLSSLEHLELSRADKQLQECKEILQAANDPVGTAFVILQEGQLAERVSNFPLAEKKFHELLSHATSIGNDYFIGLANISLNVVYQETRQYEMALHYAEKAMEYYQRMGSPRSIVHGLTFLIETHIALGNLEKVLELIEQTNAIQERMDIQFHRADIQFSRGIIAFLNSEYGTAAGFFRLSAREHYQRNYWPGFRLGCLGLAACVAEEDPSLAARLHGFAQKNAGDVKEQSFPEQVDKIVNDRLSTAQHLLGAAAFEQAAAEGAGCSLDDLIPPEDAVVPSSAPTPVISTRKLEKARFSGLTRREREIAARISQGLTNAAIAEELIISERTVTTHVTNILSKLGFSSRTQIASWAAEKGLAGP